MTDEIEKLSETEEEAGDADVPENFDPETGYYDDEGDPWPYFINSVLDGPVLPGESLHEFHRMFYFFNSAYKGSKSVADYVIIGQVTVLNWEVLRYDRMMTAVIHNQQRAGVESMFKKTHEWLSVKIADPTVKFDVAQKTKKWFADPEFRKAASNAFEAAGYSPYAVEAEAFQRSLTAIAAIDRLQVSAQKRLNAFLRDLEKRFPARAEEMRVAGDKVIAEATKT